PGTYLVREQVPTGWLQTSANPAGIVVSSGDNATGVNLGNFLPGTVSGQVFRDTNGNGGRDAGDSPLPNWTVELVLVGQTGAVRTTTTDANGNYQFVTIGPGSYEVRERRPAGYTQASPSFPGVYHFNATSGASSSGLNFGNTTHDILAVGPDAGGGPN